ncbi:hypothetical protein PP175_10110 [Aneurinibacillus sp. Ricciae_BoGa-3]|uniref:hypothetical protein n=1 Tax=Aneurinibacillus sp. Ricciae_BoGa-3 TaxID=3022697 RepID=UPI00234175C6|nr:hypothetical protein [Aneurinibacillus sp. Ricciae_BoGa-3]WCK56233.1 hypothetical protein PP175_10110 [Aneurinibacillus sp. Ricciae_BoGa-3]
MDERYMHHIAKSKYHYEKYVYHMERCWYYAPTAVSPAFAPPHALKGKGDSSSS